MVLFLFKFVCAHDCVINLCFIFSKSCKSYHYLNKMIFGFKGMWKSYSDETYNTELTSLDLDVLPDI